MEKKKKQDLFLCVRHYNGIFEAVSLVIIELFYKMG
jgi:hypothetical protein